MIDLNKLKQVYSFSKNLTLEDVNLLVKASKKKVFEKKERLIDLESDSNEVFLILKGLVRAYQVNEKGEEITLALFPENSIVSNAEYILYDEKSTYYYEAYEKTKTLSLDYKLLDEIMDKNPKLSQNRHYIYLKLMRSMYRRIESFVLFPPEERYQKYIDQYPEMINRVPDKFIANVLGITPVSLSRIRRRITKR